MEECWQSYFSNQGVSGLASKHQPFFDGKTQGLVESIKNSPYPLWYTLLWPYFFKYPSTFKWSPAKIESYQYASKENLLSSDITVVFAGDIMVLNGDVIPKLSPELIAVMNSAEIFAANCEAPVGDHKQNPNKKYSFLFHMPKDVLTGIIEQTHLKYESIILTNANNHSGDAGSTAFYRSREIMSDLGITAIGFPGQSHITKKTVGSHTLGFCGWTDWLNCPVFSTDQSPLTGDDILARSSDYVKSEHNIDYLIGMPHWEYEFQHFTRKTTKAKARKILATEMDLLIGSHPHVLQPFEWVGDKLCVYSLGNFCGLGVAWPVKIIPILSVVLGKNHEGSTCLKRYEVHFFWQNHSEKEISIEPISHLSKDHLKKVKKRINKVLRWEPCT